MTLSARIQAFIEAAVAEQVLDPLDEIYTRNRLLAIFGENAFQLDKKVEAQGLLPALDSLIDYALGQGLIDSSQSAREILEAEIMDLVTPDPSVVNATFWHYYHHDGPESATDYFYTLSQKNDYIKTRHIAKNIAFTADSEYGPLDITINLSKPEKDPEEIKRARLAESSSYPLCALCMENEGYRGHINHAARQNHRIIRMDLADSCYGFQYSPYSYYNEHAIFLHEDHIPMEVNQRCFDNLLEIVRLIPHYFVGSNADLPLVGGSILSHDHYQGGHYSFPMDRAEVYDTTCLPGYEGVDLQLLRWPMTVIRLRGKDPSQLSEVATTILNHWRTYSDPSQEVLAFSEGEPHNTVTSIARFRQDAYELDLVLRNNRTTEDLPGGLFHPHPDKHHIKKENIGLIEVMGLAILPARLVDELSGVKAYLLGQADLEDLAEVQRDWAETLKKKYPHISKAEVDARLKEELGHIFAEILADAGVFKQTESGRQALRRFVDSIAESMKGA